VRRKQNVKRKLKAVRRKQNVKRKLKAVRLPLVSSGHAQNLFGYLITNILLTLTC